MLCRDVKPIGRGICGELHFTADASGSGGTRAPFWRRTSAKVGGVMEAAERSTPNRVSPGKGCSVLRHRPVSMFQMRRVPSLEALMHCRPSAVTETALIQSVCPSSVCKHEPFPMSQMRRVPSSEALTHCRPSAVTDTVRTQSVWPFKVCKHFPLSISQIRKVLSAEALTHRRPSAVTDTDLTHSVWPSKCVSIFHVLCPRCAKFCRQKH